MKLLPFSVVLGLGLSNIACTEIDDDPDTRHGEYPINGVNYRRYTVQNEAPATRCTRRADKLAQALSASGQRAANPYPNLSERSADVMEGVAGTERFLCLTPSGRVEFFDSARMNGESLDEVAPTRNVFLHSAESIVTELASADGVSIDEIDTDATLHTGLLAGDLLEAQAYLEPWHVFSGGGRGQPLDAIPATTALARTRTFGEVDKNTYRTR